MSASARSGRCVSFSEHVVRSLCDFPLDESTCLSVAPSSTAKHTNHTATACKLLSSGARGGPAPLRIHNPTNKHIHNKPTQALEEGKPIPNELRKEEKQLRNEVELEDDNTVSSSTCCPRQI